LLTLEIFSEIWARRFAFVLAIMGSGMGWLQLAFGWFPIPDIYPIDLWLIDAYVFFGFSTFPHFSAIVALLGFQLTFFLRFLKTSSIRHWMAAVLCGVLIQPINPYLPLLGDLGVLGAAIVKWTQSKKVAWSELLAVIVLGTSQTPYFFFNLHVIRNDPIWVQFSQQALTLSPPLSYYLPAFGLLWLLAALGVFNLFRTKAVQPGTGALILWAASAIPLSFLPFVFQRRFLFALSLPVGFLAAEGIRSSLFPWFANAVKSWTHQSRQIMGWMLVFVNSLTSIYLSLGGALLATTRPESLFDSVDLVRASNWLADNGTVEDVLLSSEITSRNITSRTGMTSYLGHPVETIYYDRKTREVADFFAGEWTEDQRAEWLVSTCVKWVVISPDERENGIEGFHLAGSKLAYQSGQVNVLEIIEPARCD
jgi:hypothetical protein